MAGKTTWKQVVAKLDSIEKPSIESQYTLAWGISFLLKDRAFLDHHKGNFDEMQERIDKYVDLFPGMTRTLLCEMYNQFPKFADWEKNGVKKIHAAALVAIGKRQNAPRNESGENDDEENKPKPGRPTAKRLAELEIERDREKLARLEKEREAAELREQLKSAQQRIGELEMQLAEFRRRLGSDAAAA